MLEMRLRHFTEILLNEQGRAVPILLLLLLVLLSVSFGALEQAAGAPCTIFRFACAALVGWCPGHA
jgi:hypothetical protein